MSKSIDEIWRTMQLQRQADKSKLQAQEKYDYEQRERNRQAYLRRNEMFESFYSNTPRTNSSFAGGRLQQNSTSENTTLIWSFTTTYDNGPQYEMYWNISKKPLSESLVVTWQWTDGDGEQTIVEDSYASSTITTMLSFAAPVDDIVVTMTISDKNAVSALSVGGDPGNAGIQMKVAPDNIAGLIGTTFLFFEVQSLFEPLILTGLNTQNFRWIDDQSVVEVVLGSVNMNAFDMRGCLSLETLSNISTITVEDEADINFADCALTEASVNALLIALDASGAIDGALNISGGTNATFSGSAAGLAYDNLTLNKGWTIQDND